MSHAEHSKQQAPPTHASSSSKRFDHTMLALACVLFITATAAGAILITLPEALDAVAQPALGAPWITSDPARPAVVAASKAHAADPCDAVKDGRHD